MVDAKSLNRCVPLWTIITDSLKKSWSLLGEVLESVLLLSGCYLAEFKMKNKYA